MRSTKRIFFTLLLVTPLLATAQLYQVFPGYGVDWNRGNFTKTLHAPAGNSLALNSYLTRAGAMLFYTPDSSGYDWTGHGWRRRFYFDDTLRYLSGRFVRLAGADTINGAKTFLNNKLTLTAASNAVTGEGVFLRIVDTRTTGNYRMAGISFGTDNTLTGQLGWYASSPVVPWKGTNGIYLRNTVHNMGTYFTNTDNAGAEAKSLSLLATGVTAMGYGHTVLPGGFGGFPGGYGGMATLYGYKAYGNGAAFGYGAWAEDAEAAAFGPQAKAIGKATLVAGDGAWGISVGGNGNKIIFGDAMWAYGNLNFLYGGGHGTRYNKIISIGGQGYSVNRDDEIADGDGQLYVGWYNEANPEFSNTGYIRKIFFGPRELTTLYPLAFFHSNAKGVDKDGTTITTHFPGGTGQGMPGKGFFTTTDSTAAGAGPQVRDTVFTIAGGGRIGINTVSPSHPLDIYARSHKKIAHFDNTDLSGLMLYGKTAGSGSGQFFWDSPEGTASALFDGRGISSTAGSFGVAGSVWVSGERGAGTIFSVRPIEIGGYDDAAGYHSWMHISNNGKIGMGTLSPTAWLDVRKDTAAAGITNMLQLLAGKNAAGNGASLRLGSSAIPSFELGGEQRSANSGDGWIKTTLGGTLIERVRFLANGNVGIGDASPASLLTVGSGDLFQVNAMGKIPKYGNITPANGMLLIGHTANGTFEAGTITGSNTISVTNTPGGIQLTADTSYLATKADLVPAQGPAAPAYGELYADADGCGITLTSNAVYYKWTAATVGSTDGVTGSSVTDDLTITAGGAGTYQVNASVSFSGQRDATIRWAIFRNGSRVANLATQKNYHASDSADHVSITGILTMSEGDTIDLRVNSSVNDDVVTGNTINLNINRISNRSPADLLKGEQTGDRDSNFY